MKNIIKAVAGMIAAFTMIIAPFSGVTSLAANYNPIDMSKARFEVGLKAMDSQTGKEMVISLYEYNGQDYAYVNKSDYGLFTPVIVTHEADSDNMTNCQLFTMPEFDYVVGYGENGNMMIIFDNDNFAGSCKNITEDESLEIIKAYN